MQNNDFLPRMLREFDRCFEKSCQKFPQNNSYDLIGSETSVWKFLVDEKANVTIETQFTPADMPPDVYAGVRRRLLTVFDPASLGFGNFVCAIDHFPLEGFLPVSVVRYRSDKFDSIYAELFYDDKSRTVAAKLETAGNCRWFRIAVPQSQEPSEIWHMSDPLPEELPDSSWFDERIAVLKYHWHKRIAPVLACGLPHERLKNLLCAAIVKALLSQYDGMIRYGATRYYIDTANCAESFPPTVLTMCEVCLFFGLPDDAERFLRIFLDKFISGEGKIVHRGNGASLSEHGMLLRLVALFARSRKHDALIAGKLHIINSVVKALISDISAAPGQLLRGCPEDDVRDWPLKQWYSCNCWAARGLLEISRADIPGLNDTPTGRELPQIADNFAALVCKRCRADLIKCGSLTFVPPFAGYSKPFEYMNDFTALDPADDIHSLESYTNYRFYPETLSSGILPGDIAKNIIEFRKAKKGDWDGATNFRIFRDYPPYADCLDDWPLYNYLQGLAHYGEFEEFIRILAGHAAHHQHRKTAFAPEMSFKERLDSTHCVPSQLIVPLALKELLMRK